MFHIADQKQTEMYASSLASYKEEIPTLFMLLTESDNVPHNFWSAFIQKLVVWNLPFARYASKEGFPLTEADRRECLSHLKSICDTSPLLIIIANTQLITNSVVYSFLNLLKNFECPDLHIVLISNTISTTFYQNGMISNNIPSYPYYFSKDEELQYYEKQGLNIETETLLKIRYFTEGWPAAAAAIVEMNLMYGDIFREAPDTYIRLWLENVFFKQFTKPQFELLISLYLIDYFELELLQDLTTRDGKRLEDFLLKSPIIRYNIEKKYYTYSTYLDLILKSYQISLANKQKENFYIHVGDWYVEHDNKIRAVKCYQKAGDNRKLSLIMKQWSFPNNFETANCYADAISHMPSSFLNNHLHIYIVQMHIFCTLYRYADAYEAALSFCSHYDKKTEPAHNLAPIIGEAYVIKAYTSAVLRQTPAEILHSYKRAVELLPNGRSKFFTDINIYCDTPSIRLISPETGAMQKYLDYLEEVTPLFQQISKDRTSTGHIDLASAEMDYYQRNFDTLEIKARKAIQKGLSSKQFDLICSACFLLMRYNMAKGNYDQLMKSLAQVHSFAAEANYDTFFSMPDLADSWLQLKLGNRHQTANWIREEARNYQQIMPWNYGRDRVLHCYYLLENQLYSELLTYAEATINLFAKRRYHLLNIYLIIMKVIANWRLKSLDAVLLLMEEVYKWCAPDHIIMPLIECGNYINPVIKYCLEDDQCPIPDEWLTEIDKKAASYYAYQYNIRKEFERSHSTADSPLKDLTVSEQKLLYHISHGVSAKDICEHFNISATTLKGMSQRLYKKINAVNKSDACRIAGKYDIDKMIENH